MTQDLDELTPQQIVLELDKFIVGQQKAKKAVAIALRNRTRRRKLPDELRDEVAPKNIIMIGPTGVGKTEIARRLSRLCGAPFLKVEATKYTEVGYVGRDVESMIRDLMSVSVSMVKSEMQEQVREEAEKRTEEALLDLLLPGIKKPKAVPSAKAPADVQPPAVPDDTREKFRQRLREGKLDDKKVEIDVTKSVFPQIEIFSGTSFEEMDVNLGNLTNMFGGRKKKKRVTVKGAREIILAE
jgi:ATP-dependent HslUV protease ATP-binding subunit HslU